MALFDQYLPLPLPLPLASRAALVCCASMSCWARSADGLCAIYSDNWPVLHYKQIHHSCFPRPRLRLPAPGRNRPGPFAPGGRVRPYRFPAGRAQWRASPVRSFLLARRRPRACWSGSGRPAPISAVSFRSSSLVSACGGARLSLLSKYNTRKVKEKVSISDSAVTRSAARLRMGPACRQCADIGNFQLIYNNVAKLCIANPTLLPVSVLYCAIYGIIPVDHRMTWYHLIT